MGFSERLKKHDTKTEDSLQSVSSPKPSHTRKAIINFLLAKLCPDGGIFSLKWNVRNVIILVFNNVAPQLCHLKFLVRLPPPHHKPEPSGGEPHQLLSSVSASPLPLSCLSACSYHSLVSAPNPRSPHKAKCLAADVPQISGLFFFLPPQ